MFISPLGRGAEGIAGKQKSSISTDKSNFSDLIKQSMHEVEKKEVKPPMEDIKFSGGYKERLEQLKKLNAETDWESMSDSEKVKTFEERYKKAFNDDKFFHVGFLYEKCSEQYREMYDSYTDERHKYFAPGGLAKLMSSCQDSYREAYYGNKTDDEVRAAIREKWQGSGSMEDKFAILEEYGCCGVKKKGEEMIQYQIYDDIFAKVEGILRPSLYGTGKRPSEDPRFSQYFMTYAKGFGDGAGYRPNWTQITQSVIDTYAAAGRQGDENAMSPEALEELKGLMDDFLNELLGKEKKYEKVQ